jgi:hypothetical protein
MPSQLPGFIELGIIAGNGRTLNSMLFRVAVQMRVLRPRLGLGLEHFAVKQLNLRSEIATYALSRMSV